MSPERRERERRRFTSDDSRRRWGSWGALVAVATVALTILTRLL